MTERERRVEIAFRRRVMEAGAELIRLLRPGGYDGIPFTYSELLEAIAEECKSELEEIRDLGTLEITNGD